MMPTCALYLRAGVRWHGSHLLAEGPPRGDPGVGPGCGPVSDGRRGRVQLGLFGQLRTACA